MKEVNEEKESNLGIILVVLAVIVLGVGAGLLIVMPKQSGFKDDKPKYNTSNENNNIENNNIENNNIENNNNTTNDSNKTNIIIENIKERLISGEKIGTIIITNDSSSEYPNYIKEIYINDKIIVKEDDFNRPKEVYSVGENYLIMTTGSDINTDHYYLYNKEGTLLQELYQLEEDNMVIATSDENSQRIINGNIIELYGTRLTHGPSLVKGDKDYYICDKEALRSANVNDDYIVEAKYQLIYDSNKFDIKKIAGTEITLGKIIEENTEQCIEYNKQ